MPWIKGQAAPGRARAHQHPGGWGADVLEKQLGSDRKGLDSKAKETGMDSLSHWGINDFRAQMIQVQCMGRWTKMGWES